MPATCTTGGVLGCATSSFPWVIAGLVLLAVLLLLIRVALFMRERWAREEGAPTTVPKAPPRPVAPGSPLQPTPAKTPPPQEPKPQAKPAPLQLRFNDKPDLKPASFQGDGNVQGDFGELLTAAYLAAQGWKQLPSKLHGGRGIDGLFVREVRGGGGFECLATETKTNSAAYDAVSMSDAKLAKDIAQLFELGAFDRATADELARALRQGASFFRKELWRHDLSSGLSTVAELGHQGEKGRSITRSNARLISALYMSLERLDRRSHYLGQMPVDDADA